MEFNNRQCKKCNIVKSIELFQKRPECTSGYGYTCKECANVVNKLKQMNRYYENHEEELRKKREYKAANKDKINQRRREQRAILNEMKPKPDIFVPYHQVMLSEIPEEYLKNLAGYNVTVDILRVLAKRNNIKLGKLTKKFDIIQKLINNDILSDIALCETDDWETEEEIEIPSDIV